MDLLLGGEWREKGASEGERKKEERERETEKGREWRGERDKVKGRERDFTACLCFWFFCPVCFDRVLCFVPFLVLTSGFYFCFCNILALVTLSVLLSCLFYSPVLLSVCLCFVFTGQKLFPERPLHKNQKYTNWMCARKLCNLKYPELDASEMEKLAVKETSHE